MIPFLKQVATHYADAEGLSSRLFVFPSRRSMVFFRKYLTESLAGRTAILPQMLTMDEFFYSVASARADDKVGLLLTLYDCYKELNPKAEPLDEFIFWGDVILSDFDDADKYLADPAALFANVAEFRQMQDLSYLSETQRAALENFVRHFEGEAKRGDVKDKFLGIWNLLYPLYTRFTVRLASGGTAYGGMIYRKVAESFTEGSAADILSERFPDVTCFVFVGLNALNECELAVMRKMAKASLAEFCWDYSDGMISDRHNRSSLFMSGNTATFRQAFKVEVPPAKAPDIEVVYVPSGIGQAKQLPRILAEIADKCCGGDLSRVGSLDVPGAGCAVVLPDESLLMPVLNSIPSEIRAVNVTMGCPVSGSQPHALLHTLSGLVSRSRKIGGKTAFYHRQVRELLANSLYVKSVPAEQAGAVESAVEGQGSYIFPDALPKDSSAFGILSKVEDVIRLRDSSESGDASVVKAFGRMQLEVLTSCAVAVSGMDDARFDLEFCRRCCGCITRLMDEDLPVQIPTYSRLLDTLLSVQTVPFEGEPLKGLQVMGPLEMRAMDFDNLVILSANEGMFPRRTVSSSFIPPELRKGFGLPTYERQDAVWAYYFYRMIQRPSRVWMLCDTRTEGLRGGEESRYIKQLEYHFRVPLHKVSVANGKVTGEPAPLEIPKPDDIAAILSGKPLSASSLQDYLACQVRFFYSFVEGLSPKEESSESLDSGMVGNVFHHVMQALYLGDAAMEPAFSMERSYVREAVASGRLVPLKEVTASYLHKWLDKGSLQRIKDKITALVLSELGEVAVSGRDLVTAEVILKYVLNTLKHDLGLLNACGARGFEVLGLEIPGSWTLAGQSFFGYIDRLDRLDGRLRIVDYKTGKVTDGDIVTDENAVKSASALFAEKGKNRPKIALQMYLYDRFVSGKYKEPVYNCIYSTGGMFREKPVEAPENGTFRDMVGEHLEEVIRQMRDTSVPFRRTEDTDTCRYCKFKTLCGR